MSRSSQGHDLYKICRAPVTDASHQFSKSLAHWFWRRRFLKVFSIYSHGGHLGNVTLTIYTNFHSLFLRMLHKNFGFDWPNGFREEDVSILWSYTCIIALAQGQTTPWAQNIFLNINLLSICSFLASFLPFNYIFLFFPIPMHGRPKLTLP